MRRICATLLGLILVAHVAPARVEAQGGERTLGQIGYGTGAAVKFVGQAQRPTAPSPPAARQ